MLKFNNTNKILIKNNKLYSLYFQSAIEQQTQAEEIGTETVNPEFLAALPPAIQEEVLAQQRLLNSRGYITIYNIYIIYILYEYIYRE